MGGYGYTYRSISTYNTTLRDEARGPVTKPFVPFVPDTNPNINTEGYVTRKTIVPVASRPYDDDYNHHSSPAAEAYPARGDDKWHRQTSPVRGSPRKVDDFLTKVQNEASRPARLSPVTSTEWRQSPQPTAYSGPNGYGSNKEERKPVVGAAIRNDSYDGYDGPNGYRDYGKYGNKEGRKPIGGPVRNDSYDGYNGPNGYGGYGDYNNKEGRKPIGSPIRNDKYDGYNRPNGYGDYSNKEGHKPITSPIRNGSPVRNDNYDGYNGGNGYGDYGSYRNKEGHSPIRNDNYDRHRPTGNYSAVEPNKIIPGGWNKPKISSAWAAAPRKGTQISEPTTDIDKAIELLKDAANLNGRSADARGYDDHSNKGGLTSKFDKGMDLVKEAERLKNIVTTGPHQSRTSVLMEPETPNKDYGETIDRRDATRRYGNFNFLSRPRTSPRHVTFIDGREDDYRDNINRRDDARRYGNEPRSIIDSREAAEIYNGRRV